MFILTFSLSGPLASVLCIMHGVERANVFREFPVMNLTKVTERHSIRVRIVNFICKRVRFGFDGFFAVLSLCDLSKMCILRMIEV